MVTKVHMEALSPTMEEGQLVQWLKSEGDEVSSGDILAEIETDKATMELVARGDGILRKIFLDAGGVSAVGSVIAVIATADEDISGVKGALGGDDTQEASSEEPAEAETVVPEEPEAATISEITTPTDSGSSSEEPASGTRPSAVKGARKLALSAA